MFFGSHRDRVLFRRGCWEVEIKLGIDTLIDSILVRKETVVERDRDDIRSYNCTFVLIRNLLPCRRQVCIRATNNKRISS